MLTVSCVSFLRIIRIIGAYHPYHSVSLRIIGLKWEFLNRFISLTKKRIMRIISPCVWPCVPLFEYFAMYLKNKKIIIRPAMLETQNSNNCLKLGCFRG